MAFPQKVALIRLTDRPPQLETPRQWYATDFTPNAAFYVRWHLDGVPTTVDLAEWRLHVEGRVAQPLTLSMRDLLADFAPIRVAAVNQCSGNSRSRVQPRVPGGQWGHGAMGNAMWTGVRLVDVLKRAGVQDDAVQIQFQGLEQGKGPAGKPSFEFMKSLPVGELQECLIAYAMNGEPLPMLNGFPVRLIVPGYFATYWMKCLTWIRALNQVDTNFWMAAAYRIPDTPTGGTTPEEQAAGTVKSVPINRMPVRSFFVQPDEQTRIPVGFPVELSGIAFSGHGGITQVEVSVDKGATWAPAALGPDHGPWSFRRWTRAWQPDRAGTWTLAVRATDAQGNVQTDTPVWNSGGYMFSSIEKQQVYVGEAGS
jgi:DMSO/TMAO reductase YedYZ molybdopterin-dependent catalytic subunit